MIQVGQDFVLPPAGSGVKIQVEAQDHGDLSQGKPDVKQTCQHCEDQAGGEKYPEAGFRQVGQSFMEGLLTHTHTPDAA